MSRYVRWQAILTALGIVFVAIVLAQIALGREPEPTPLPTCPTVMVKVPARGGTFVEGVAGYPQFINPLFSQFNEVDRDLCALIFEGLTTVNEHDEIVPLLARDWEVSDDGLVYTFHLRDSVRWQDGKPFTADDVVFTIGLMQDPDFPGLPSLADLWRSVEVSRVDTYTVQFRLHEAYAPFLDYTTIGIVPRHVLKDVPVSALKEHRFNYAPVGTGLFRVQELTADHMVLEANPYHRLWSKTMIDRIEFKFYPDYEHILAAYEAGEVMGVSRILPEDMQRARANPNLQLLSARLSGYSVIFINLRNPDTPFFQDRRVRQAMMYALDRRRLIDQVLQGQGMVIHSPIMPQSWAYDPQVPKYEYSPERAMSLLDQAGWKIPDSRRLRLDIGTEVPGVRVKKDRPLEFTLLVNDVPERVALARAVADQWAQVGIKAHVRAVSMSELTLDHLRPRKFDAVLSQWQSLPPDPDPYPVWHSTQITGTGQNYSGFVNRDADEAIEVARQLTDREKRKELYIKFQQVFAQEVPAILLYQPVYTYGVDRRVRNVQIAPMLDPSGRFRTVWQWAVREKKVPLHDFNDQVGDELDRRGDLWYHNARR